MTRLLLISYDLNKASAEEYKALSEYLESLGNPGWTKPLESVYIVQTALSPKDVNAGIKKVLTNEEGVLRQDTKWLVLPVKLGEGSGWLSKKHVDWWGKAVDNGL